MAEYVLLHGLIQPELYKWLSGLSKYRLILILRDLGDFATTYNWDYSPTHS